MSLLDCHVPPGFKIEFDLSKLSPRAKKAVRRYLEQGYKGTFSGETSQIYEYFRKRHGLPNAYAGRARRAWFEPSKDLWARLSPDTKEAAAVIERLYVSTMDDRARRYYRALSSSSNGYLYVHGTAGARMAEAVIKKFNEDPELERRRQEALKDFDSTTVLVREG